MHSSLGSVCPRDPSCKSGVYVNGTLAGGDRRAMYVGVYSYIGTVKERDRGREMRDARGDI